MKKPSDLTKEELAQLVEQLQSIIYLDIASNEDFWNRNKVWDECHSILQLGAIVSHARESLQRIPGFTELRNKRGSCGMRKSALRSADGAFYSLTATGVCLIFP
jgi:hypothetical protein